VISDTALKSVAASAITKMQRANQRTQVGMSMNYPKGVLLPTVSLQANVSFGSALK
jgi:hypothetical protein